MSRSLNERKPWRRRANRSPRGIETHPDSPTVLNLATSVIRLAETRFLANLQIVDGKIVMPLVIWGTFLAGIAYGLTCSHHLSLATYLTRGQRGYLYSLLDVMLVTAVLAEAGNTCGATSGPA